MPFERGPLGHSDGDVLCHALVDAMLRRGRRGRHRPPLSEHRSGAGKTRPAWTCWRAAVAIVARLGWSVVQCGCDGHSRAPQAAPHIEPIRERLAAVLGVSRRSRQREGQDQRGRRRHRAWRGDRRARGRGARRRVGGSDDACACVLRRVRPVICTSATPGPRCSTGCSRAGTAARSSCASRTPMPSVPPANPSGHPGRPAVARASIGTRDRMPAGRTDRTGSPSGSICIDDAARIPGSTRPRLSLLLHARAARRRTAGRARGGVAAEVQRPLPRARSGRSRDARWRRAKRRRSGSACRPRAT